MKKIPIDKIWVVDLEATCWNENTAPEGQMSEIIEIGIAIMTRTKNLKDIEIEKLDILVKPVVSEISEFCTQLTTLTRENMKNDWIKFDQALNIMRNHGSRNVFWCSCGDYDRQMFVKQCQRMNLEYPFSDGCHINVKTLFGLMKHQRGGMMRMLEHFKIPLSGTHHRGVDDAYNTALVMKQLLGW